MGSKKISRQVKRIGVVEQASLSLFEEEAHGQALVKQPEGRALRFEDPDPREIRFGGRRLDEHLREMGLPDALVVRRLLSEQDWGEFVSRYSAVGRPGYAPWLMAGVVLFGLMRGVNSLRELERFARGDLECMWVSGGIAPDHSILGRFIVRHEQELGGALFESIVQTALKRTGSGRERLAGDGTVLEAMSSRFALIKREALLEQRRQVPGREPGQQGGAEQDGLQEAAVLDEPTQVEQQASEEQEVQEDEQEGGTVARARQTLSERPKAKAIVPAEPEAGLLKLKNGRGSRPGYQAAVLANAARVVVDAQVDSTSEQAALLEQLQRLGPQTRELLLDAGFNNYPVLELAVQRDISLLCPEGGESARHEQAQGDQEPKGCLPMRLFSYMEEGDYYLCPAGQRMYPCRRYEGNATQGKRAYLQYATPACGSCDRRAQCTKRQARTVQRTQGQELKEALRQVMAQPGAQKLFAQRKAMVEPVFSMLRERQGLNRFHRRGLAGVRLEFRLHLMAYNLGRALAYVGKNLQGLFLHGLGAIRTVLRLLGSPSAQMRELHV